MAKDIGTADQSSGQIQHADATITGHICQAPFARYWHKPAISPAPLASKLEPKTPQNTRHSGSSPDINIFQTPIADNAVMTIDLLKTEPSEVVELQTSDEDEVVEVALPPKPTITIESSDEESAPVVVVPPVSESPQKPTPPPKTSGERNKKQKNKRHAGSASPVPSVVSSISDDFIRTDCLSFNISRRQEVEKFDFSLHGSDLIEQHSNTLDQSNTSLSLQKSNKKRNKKKKDRTLSPHLQLEPSSVTSTPSSPSPNFVEHNFSTPKSSKCYINYAVSESSIPNADVYESDSNQSAQVDNLTETNVFQKPSMTEKSSVAIEPHTEEREDDNRELETAKPVQVETGKILDLTDQYTEVILDPAPLEHNLAMGNVTGMDSVPEVSSFRKTKSPRNTVQVPSQMLEIVTFKSKRNCRRAMEKYYNESWGGENFDHHDIQMTMPRDHTLWAVDPRDRVKSSNVKKRRCHYCNQVGHHYDRCHWKPRICHMCGMEGHYEPRCPNKICLRCGAPNGIYSVVCRNCANWNRIMCNICKCFGHPVEACPDHWRRYHNTVENDGILNRQQWRRKPGELFCSGCTRRGHLVHTCRQIPFSNLPLQNPFVFQYSPIFPPAVNPDYPTVGPSGRYFTLHEEQNPPAGQHLPAQNSHSPFVQNQQPNSNQLGNDQSAHVQNHQAQSCFESDVSKRLLSISETPSPLRTDKRQAAAFIDQTPTKRRSVSSKETTNEDESCAVSSTTSEAAIQDGEVSNTSDVVTTAKVFVEKSAIEELKKPEGSEWLSVASAQNRVNTKLEESPTTFVVVSGLPADQEAFQKELREFLQRSDLQNQSKYTANDVEGALEDFSKDIPKNKNDALRMLNAAFTSLQADLGDPKTCYKELRWLQNRHMKLLKEKVISPQQLKHSRRKMNGVLKHLNMILLGQAGLAEGSQCMKELRALHEVLTKFRKNSLPQELRTKVGENYHFVFDPVARADYPELMNQYYNERDQSVVTPKAMKALQNRIQNNNFQRNKINKKRNRRQKRQEAVSGNTNEEDVRTPNLQSQSNKKSKPHTTPHGNQDKKRIIMNRIKSCQRKLCKIDGSIDGQKQGMKNNLMSRLSKAAQQVQVEQNSKLNIIRKKVYKLVHTIESFCR